MQVRAKGGRQGALLATLIRCDLDKDHSRGTRGILDSSSPPPPPNDREPRTPDCGV